MSKETPLCIEINATADVLTVKNNMNHKRITEHSTGTGIKNIINRYKLVTSREVLISKTSSAFMVSLPLIKLSEYERINN